MRNQKPVDYTEFLVAMRTIDTYWSLSELPYDEGQTADESTRCATGIG